MQTPIFIRCIIFEKLVDTAAMKFQRAIVRLLAKKIEKKDKRQIMNNAALRGYLEYYVSNEKAAIYQAVIFKVIITKV